MPHILYAWTIRIYYCYTGSFNVPGQIKQWKIHRPWTVILFYFYLWSFYTGWFNILRQIFLLHIIPKKTKIKYLRLGVDENTPGIAKKPKVDMFKYSRQYTLYWTSFYKTKLTTRNLIYIHRPDTFWTTSGMQTYVFINNKCK